MSELSELASPTAYRLEPQTPPPEDTAQGELSWRALGAPHIGIDFAPGEPALPPFTEEMAALHAELAAARDATAAANERAKALTIELRLTQAQLRASGNRNNLLLDQLAVVQKENRGLHFANLDLKLQLAWTKEELEEVLGKFSEALAVSESLEYAAKTDPLTALDNRRALAEKFEAHDRWGFGFLTDVDNFKLANDLLGHAIGDRILEKIGLEICHSVRDQDTDIVARLGGDEYMGVIALPTPDPEQKEEQDISSEGLATQLEKEIPTRIAKNVRACLKKLCQDISEEPEFKDNPKRLLYLALVFSKLDISIGTVRYLPGMSFEELYFYADHKMYEMKNERRVANNRLATEESMQLTPSDSENAVELATDFQSPSLEEPTLF